MRILRLYVVQDIGHMVDLKPGDSPVYVQEVHTVHGDSSSDALMCMEPMGNLFTNQMNLAAARSYAAAFIAQESTIVMAEVVYD